MKKALFLALIFTTFIFFTGCPLDSTDTHTVAVLAEMAARNVGLEVGKTGDEQLDRSLRNIYQSLKTGTLTPDALVQLSNLTQFRPTLAPDIMSLISLLGVKNEEGSLLVRKVPAEILAGLEKGYLQGIMLGKNVE